MAYLRRIPRSPFWIAAYRDGAGKLANKSTKLLATPPNRAKAQKIADAYEGAYRAHNAADHFREHFQSIIKQIDPEAVQAFTVREYFDLWMKGHSGELAASTIANYTKRLNDFVEYVGKDKLISIVKRANALGFRALIAEQTSNATANIAMRIMSGVFACAMNEGVIVGNPFAKVKPLVSDSITKKHFTFAQVKRLFGVADAEWQSLILFGLYTGQRLGDIATLTWSQVDFEQKEILFTTQKTGRNMATPAPDIIWEHIASLDRGLPESPIHPRAFAIKRKTGVSGLSRGFRHIMVKAGLVTPYEHQRERAEKGDTSKQVSELTFHSIRHSNATWLRDVGASESTAMELLGHDSKSVDRAYVHSDPERMRAELNKLPRIV